MARWLRRVWPERSLVRFAGRIGGGGPLAISSQLTRPDSSGKCDVLSEPPSDAPASPSLGAERTLVREHRKRSETEHLPEISGRRFKSRPIIRGRLGFSGLSGMVARSRGARSALAGR